MQHATGYRLQATDHRLHAASSWESQFYPTTRRTTPAVEKSLKVVVINIVPKDDWRARPNERHVASRRTLGSLETDVGVLGVVWCGPV